ncbi:hypothetical protein BP5796_12971 [Coleophoma crateriformis]|uniref:Dipeptidyl-peptidase V n=1 Tax=Coleophoma crateriformis TaxID=565419 RepID=A0A3D8Q664_9HELO|nr:hypothetical protein BP5796_12971 [Coleophoma crateriformis]
MDLIGDVLDLIVPTRLTLSPDGKSVAYSTRLKWNHKKDDYICPSIWMAETGLQKSARRLTDGLFNDKMPQWSPSSEVIAFVSDRGKQGRANAIYLLPLGTNTPRAITPAENEQQILKFKFSPDGKQIAFICAPENIQKATIVSLFNKNAHVTDFDWSDSGTEIAFTTLRTPHVESQYIHGTTLSIVRIEDRELRTVCHMPRGVSSLTWSGSVLYFITNNTPEHDTSGFAVYSVKLVDEESIYEKVADGEENCTVSLVRAGKEVLVHVEHGLEDQLRALNGHVLLSCKKRIVEIDAVYVRDRNDMVIAFTQGDVNNPTEVLSVTTAQETTQLSNHGSIFASQKFGECTFVQCPTIDGNELLNGIYLTPTSYAGLDDKPTIPLPTFVLLHGGPYTRMTNAFDVWDPLSFLIPSFLSEGYGILIPNYRGSSGKGERFASYARGGMGIYDEVDVVAMTQYAVQQGYADKNKLLAGGWSQGGYLAFLLSVRNGRHGFGWQFKGLIAGAGVTDWDSLVLASDVGYMQAQLAGGSPWSMDKSDTRTRAGSALWEFKDALEMGTIPPILIMHGEKDARVPISQAWGFRRALDEAGLPFEFVTYPREGHFFRERKHVEDLLKRMFRFVKEHIS